MARPIRLVAFDMDGVLVDSYSSWALVHQHFGTDNDDSLAAFLRGEIDDMEFIRRDVERWSGVRGRVPWDEVRAVLDRAPLVPGALETLRELGDRGTLTAIISGGLRYLAEGLGTRGAVPFVRANDVVVDEEGCLTGEGVVHVPLLDKGSVLGDIQDERGIGVDETAAVGDTRVDLSLFRQARISIAFSPSDEVTADAATHVVRSRDLRAVLPLLER